jgi:polyadenylate-binding protein
MSTPSTANPMDNTPELEPQLMISNLGPSSTQEVSFQTSSLYVGDLAPDVNEGLLFEIFNAVGPVASIRVCRDAITRRSLGYAYVNFHQIGDAERALDTMNYTMIKTRPCRIMWSQRDPSLRRSGVGNIFVKNLHESIDNKQLYDTFSLFGNILSCKVVTDRETGGSKGYGYIHYETAEAAYAAIDKLDGMLIDGQEVQVGHFMRRNERPGQNDWTNCYVKNVPLEWDDAQFLEEFSKFGEVVSCSITKGVRKTKKNLPSSNGDSPQGDDSEPTNESKDTDEANETKEDSLGFGFVNYQEHEGAASAIEALNGKEFKTIGEDGEETTVEMYVGRAQKKAERERELRAKFDAEKMDRISKFQGVNLYVKNLDDSVTDDQLRDEFAAMGTITSARVMKDMKDGRSRGFGFVCFSTPEEATRAVNEMNGMLLNNKPIFVALAQRREVRRAQLEAQHATRGPGVPGPGQPGMMRGGPMGAPMGYPGAMPMFMQRQGPGGAMQPAYPMMPQMMGGPGGRGGGPRPGGYPGMMPNQPGRGGYPMPYGIVPGQPGRGGGRGRGRGPMIPGRGGPIPMAGRGPPNPNIKFNQQVRNAGTPGGMPPGPMPQGVQPPQPHIEGALTASALASASPEMQKNMIGERLYPLIHQSQPELAGKITGMLLEMDNSELLHLLESPEALNAKISEALQVLEAHNANASE